jgi:AraC-like DNA-binding protein
MQVIGNPPAVKPGDCFEHWHQVTCRSYSLTECRRVPDENFQARVSFRGFGALALSEIWSSTSPESLIRVTRTPREIRKDFKDHFLIWLMLAGETVLTQAGRQARIYAGDIVLQDQSQPLSLEFAKHSHALLINVPRALLTSRLPAAPDLAARRIGAGSSLGQLAAMVFHRVSQFEETTDPGTVGRVGASALDLLATTLEAELTDSIVGDSRTRKRLEQAKRYILSNLHDPDLDLATIARSQGAAPRTLNRLFAAEGTTPVRWLWQQRLAASFRALAEGHSGHVTDVALTYGFTDLSHFSRAFKAEFGRSPRAVRLGEHRQR